jgi:phospholipase/carboxylesterase
LDLDLGFVHRFERGKVDRTLLLLHGTGGSENDLIPLGSAIDEEANLLSPRGNVLEGEMPRFFRRFEEGVFDLEDVERRSHELAHFVGVAAQRYGFSKEHLVAVGYSNGANIAASTLLLRPETMKAAVLLRSMLTLTPDPVPDLNGKSVLMMAGSSDEIVPRKTVHALADLLKGAGAEVDLRWLEFGHGLTRLDLETAREFRKKVLDSGPV